MNSKNNKINIIVCGGSGAWAEQNHYPAMLCITAAHVRVVAICDPINPYKPQKNERRKSLEQILERDEPQWINPRKKDDATALRELNKLLKLYPNCALVISTNPDNHYLYCKWGLERKVPIMCDKPLVTAKNSAFDPSQAKLIQAQYDELYKLYESNKQDDPHYVFCSPLRRRALTPFLEVAKSLEQVHNKTKEGIRYMNVIVNGGIHKYPAEYTKGGAHGHLGGVGTLSHSSYHYIDVIAWYLKLASGNTKTIDMSLTYILRVSEYLQTNSYKKLRDLIEGDGKDFNDRVTVPKEVLNSELDFSFGLKLLDAHGNTVGNINYIVNYSTFAPRLVYYDPEVTEYAHHKHGGRMSSIYFDIHQGALQQWQIIKNDEVAKGHNIELSQNIHPLLGGTNMRRTYDDAYEKGTFTARSLFQSFIKSCLKQKIRPKETALLSTIETQALTHRLYSLMYEKIAEEFYDKQYPRSPLKSNSTINLEQYTQRSS